MEADIALPMFGLFFMILDAMGAMFDRNALVAA